MRAIHRLTAKFVKKETKPGLYAYGLNLYLQIQPPHDNKGNIVKPTPANPCSSKSWLFRYMMDGKARSMGFGVTHLIPLDEAREKAAEAMRLVKAGIDPREQRDAEKAARKAAAKPLVAAPVWTFAKAAAEYIKEN